MISFKSQIPNHPEKCLGVKGPTYTKDQCRLCWLASYDKTYSKKWKIKKFNPKNPYKGKKITIYGPFSLRDGYGNAVVNFSKELIELGVDVRIVPQVKNCDDDVAPAILKRKGEPRGDNCEIVLMPPHFINLFRSKKRVLFTMYEHDKLTKNWVTLCNQVDLNIVPCTWCKEVWQENGIEAPTEIVPLGLDVESWPYLIRPKRDSFTFLMVGTLLRRKNPSTLIQAFLEEFKEPNAKLIIKSLEHLPITFHGEDPRVQIINESYSQEKLISLYRQADCFVYPSSGEGFGLPPLEAMSTGLPVIFTNATGMRDFARPGFNFPLPIAITETIVTSVGNEGTVPIPCVKTLKHFMRFCYENRDYVNGMGYHASNWVQETFTWKKATLKLLQVLDGLGFLQETSKK